MLNWFTKFWKIERSRRLSIIFGFMIGVGLILVALGIMASIKVTPYATYKNKRDGFSIKFPAYWKVIPHPDGGAIIAFVSPKQNELDTIQDNLNVSIKILPNEMTLERLSQMIVNQVTGTFGEQVDITQSIPVTLGGRLGYRITFVGYGKRIPNPVQYVVAWTNISNRVFIITFTGLQKDYPFFEGKVNDSIRSFRFIPVEAH